MKYKLLKYIESENSIQIGTTFETGDNYIHMDNGMRIPAAILIEQGFIEEVKETPKPKWRVGDYVVDCENRFVKIFSVSKKDDPIMYNEVYTGQGYFGILERDIRDPTEEELSIYFR